MRYNTAGHSTQSTFVAVAGCGKLWLEVEKAQGDGPTLKASRRLAKPNLVLISTLATITVAIPKVLPRGTYQLRKRYTRIGKYVP